MRLKIELACSDIGSLLAPTSMPTWITSLSSEVEELKKCKTLPGTTVRRFVDDICVGDVDASNLLSLTNVISAIKEIPPEEWSEVRELLNKKTLPSWVCLAFDSEVCALSIELCLDRKTDYDSVSACHAKSESPYSVVVQGNQCPMISGDDVDKVINILKKRDKMKGKVGKKQPVEGVVSGAVEMTPLPGGSNDAVGGAGIAKAAKSSPMMPPPNLPKAGSKHNSMISKKLCEITQFPEFAVNSLHSIQFRQRDEKVATAELLAKMGKYETISKAHAAILQLVETNDAMVNDLASLEIDDKLLILHGKSVILTSFPDAIELLHRLKVCTIVPAIATATDPIEGQRISEAIEASIASDVCQGVNTPKVAASTASGAARPVSTKLTRCYDTKPARALKELFAIGALDDSCFEDKVIRQLKPAEVDEKGKDIGGRWGLTDSISAVTGDTRQVSLQWVKTHIHEIKEIASSLTYKYAGHPSVSFITSTKIYIRMNTSEYKHIFKC